MNIELGTWVKREKMGKIGKTGRKHGKNMGKSGGKSKNCLLHIGVISMKPESATTIFTLEETAGVGMFGLETTDPGNKLSSPLLAVVLKLAIIDGGRGDKGGSGLRATADPKRGRTGSTGKGGLCELDSDELVSEEVASDNEPDACSCSELSSEFELAEEPYVFFSTSALLCREMKLEVTAGNSASKRATVITIK
jgi:hypothetical protein